MKLRLLNTAEGLKPMYDADYDEKKHLKLGKVYEATITLVRNPQFHKKYFALINLAWEYLNERQQEFFKNNKEVFRKAVEVAAGHCELHYSIARKEWLEIPKSISFEKMDEAEFSAMYERVKDVLFEIFLKSVNQEEFINNLQYF